MGNSEMTPEVRQKTSGDTSKQTLHLFGSLPRQAEEWLSTVSLFCFSQLLHLSTDTVVNPKKLTQLKAEIICNAGQLGNEKNHGLAMHVYVAAGFVDSVNRDYAVVDV